MRELSPIELANEIKMVAQITERLLLHPLSDMTGIRDHFYLIGEFYRG